MKDTPVDPGCKEKKESELILTLAVKDTDETQRLDPGPGGRCQACDEGQQRDGPTKEPAISRVSPGQTDASEGWILSLSA